MNGESKYGGLSMRNIMIRKKLAERKRFDSADHVMQKIGLKDYQEILPSKTEEIKPILQISTDSTGYDKQETIKNGSDMCVQSPVQIGMTAFFNSMGESKTETPTQNMDGMTLSPANRQTNIASDAKLQSKYGALSARNIILRRKLAQRTKFDSADYQLQKYGHGEINGVELSTDMEITSSNIIVKEAMEPQPAPMEASTSTPSAPNYGKLCAQNILFRKKLKERNRFDSADYSMENSESKSNLPIPVTSQGLLPAPADLTRPYLDNYQTKHLKMSVESPKPVQKELASGRDLSSPTSRVAARNIVLQRKLQERKRFDSADYYKEKSNRQ